MIWLTSHARVKPDGVRADATVVGPDLSAAPRATACPSCGASVRPDAAFCGQCYADFRPKPAAAPAPPPPTAPAPTAAYGVPAGDPLTAPLLDFLPEVPTAPATAVGAAAPAVPAGEPTWPCQRCDSANPIAASVCEVCGSSFLAAVSEESKISLVLPGIGDLGRFSRAQRIALAFGALAAVLLPLALVTLLLTDRPPATPAPSSPGTVVTTTP